jgi:hypothetical protein
MDILNVFNLVICDNIEGDSGSVGWIFNLIFAPMNILIPTSKFAILAWFTILIFFILIYSSQSQIIKVFNTDNRGNKSWINSLFCALLLYTFQTSIILLFLRYNICHRTLEWADNNYHLELRRYNTDQIEERTGY